MLDHGIGHFIPAADPQIVITATQAVLVAAASHAGLAACQCVFQSVTTAECLSRGQFGHQQT